MIYVSQNGVQQGSYGIEEINRLLATGKLDASDLAWQEGMPDWQPLSVFPGVRVPAQTGPPPLPGGPPAPTGDAFAPPLSYIGPPAGGPPATSGMAVASMVLGIICLILFFTLLLALVIGLLAVVFGHVSRSTIKQSGGRLSGSGIALAGLITGYIGMLLPFVMLGVVAASYKSIMSNGRNLKAEANIATIASYIQIYTVKHNGQPPSQAAGLRALVTSRILTDEELLTDPWGEPVEYIVPARRSEKKYDIWSRGPDGISGNEDDIGNW